MNDLEELFNRQPPYSDADLDRIITHMREARANYEAGVKPKKEKGEQQKAVNLSALGLAKPKPTVGGLQLGMKKP